MPGFNNNINVCDGFVASLYLCYITVYVSLCNKENIAKQSIHIYTYYTQMMKLKSSTKMITMTVMTKKVTTMMMCDDDDSELINSFF